MLWWQHQNMMWEDGAKPERWYIKAIYFAVGKEEKVT